MGVVFYESVLHSLMDPRKEKGICRQAPSKMPSTSLAYRKRHSLSTELEDDVTFESRKVKMRLANSPSASKEDCSVGDDASKEHLERSSALAWRFDSARMCMRVSYCDKCPRGASLVYDDQKVVLTLPLCSQCVNRLENVQTTTFVVDAQKCSTSSKSQFDEPS